MVWEIMKQKRYLFFALLLLLTSLLTPGVVAATKQNRALITVTVTDPEGNVVPDAYVYAIRRAVKATPISTIKVEPTLWGLPS
jgi:hypothetical protein